MSATELQDKVVQYLNDPAFHKELESINKDLMVDFVEQAGSQLLSEADRMRNAAAVLNGGLELQVRLAEKYADKALAAGDADQGVKGIKGSEYLRG